MNNEFGILVTELSQIVAGCHFNIFLHDIFLMIATGLRIENRTRPP